MKLVIAEKPSVAQSLAAVIGATARKDGYLAVSYTHLDVYKRQRQYGEECANCPYTLDERKHGICRRCAVFKK